LPEKLTPARYSRRLAMDYDILINAISTIGFPIVVACALFWYINKQNENHKEEINALRDTIGENTNILHELKELIKVIAK
jgi:large-conductance mechanosensitive channel